MSILGYVETILSYMRPCYKEEKERKDLLEKDFICLVA